MTKCSKCNTKVKNQFWIVDEVVYCSPRCERSSWDAKARKWTTKFHRFGDKQVENKGVAGLAEKRKRD